MAFYISKSREGWKLTDDDWNILEDDFDSKRELGWESYYREMSGLLK